MADHLGLPQPIAHQDRRQGSSFGSTDRRDPTTHGRELQQDLESAQAAPLARVVDGVDPRRVFKIRGSTRIGDEELAARNLEFLGDTSDWTYFVVPSDQDAEELHRAIDAYAATDGGSPPLSSFFDRVARIEPYGPEDRVTPPLAAALERDEWPLVVDVVVWSSANDEEARSRVDDVRAACEQYQAEVLGSDSRARTAAARVRCGNPALLAILGLTVVESVRLPLAPLLEPSTWLAAEIAPAEVPAPLEVVIGILDDGVAVGHPLLSGVVVADDSVPSTHSWKEPGPHGTMVAGLAAYGGFEQSFAEGQLRLPRPVRLACVRVLEPDDSGDPNSTRFPSGVPDHRVLEDSIRLLHEEHGVRIINLSVTDRFPYSAQPQSDVEAAWDRTLNRSWLRGRACWSH